MPLPYPKMKQYRLYDDSCDQLLDQFNLISISRAVETYYDTTIKTFYNKGLFIRENGLRLEIKANPYHPAPLSCDYKFNIPFDENQKALFQVCARITGIKQPSFFSFKMFLKDNALRPILIIDVARRTYANDTLHLTLEDDLKYGTFLTFKDKDKTRPFDAFTKEVNTRLGAIKTIPIDTHYITQLLKTPTHLMEFNNNFVKTLDQYGA